MNILYGAYTLLTSVIFITCLPPFLVYTLLGGRHGKNLKERLGYISPERIQTLSGTPRIWIHAVSLGEVKVAAPIIKALKEISPHCSIILSTTTEHGRTLARETLGEDVTVIYPPIDFIGSVRNALSRTCPDVLVFLETEIWPAWFTEAKRMGIKIALINGRISIRTIEGYLNFRSFFHEILKNVDAFSMISEEDGNRIISMGADPDKIHINRNAKYDLLANMVDPSTENEMRRILNLEPSQSVFVAGSTRRNEETLILDAYEIILRDYPDMVLIIAPRHIERTRDIVSLLEKRGYGYQLRNQLNEKAVKRTEPVVIINTFGELFKLYSIGTVVFCGGSLAPLGGQNPLEPAVWGKVVLYGPYMEDVLDAKTLLEKVGAGIPVSNADMLAEKAIHLLNHPDELKKYGAQGREAVIGHQNAAGKHARVIKDLIS